MSDIQDIKQAHPMPEVVRGYGIEINRAGFCRCPFHTEKTASMKIYPTSFFCYGCGAGGDVIDFVRLYEHCDFKTAYAMLGGTYHRRNDAEILKAIRMRVKQDEKEAENRRKWQALRVAQEELADWRAALDIIPIDSPVRAAALTHYYYLQQVTEEKEDEYFNRKGGSG